VADLPALASIEALEARLGRGTLTGAQLAQALAALADASEIVRAETNRTWVNSEGVVVAPAVVVTITLRAALRDVRNPDGNIAENAGPFSRRLADDQTKGVYLLDEERAVLEKYRLATPGLWTQPTTRGEYADVVWLDDQYGGDSILWAER
jgi:hypothetical protein